MRSATRRFPPFCWTRATHNGSRASTDPQAAAPPAKTGSSPTAVMAPGAVRARGRDIECLQIRLSPVVAHAVLGACSELGGTVAALDDLWGRDAARIQEQLRAAGSWDDRFAIAQAALAQRFEAGRAASPEVAFAWEQMVTRPGQIRVAPPRRDGAASDCGPGSGPSSASPPNAPPSSSASTTPPTASPPVTAPPWSPRKPATPTSPTSTATSWPSPGQRPRPSQPRPGSRSTPSPGPPPNTHPAHNSTQPTPPTTHPTPPPPPPPAPPAPHTETSPQAPRRHRRLASCACPQRPHLASSPAPPGRRCARILVTRASCWPPGREAEERYGQH